MACTLGVHQYDVPKHLQNYFYNKINIAMSHWPTFMEAGGLPGAPALAAAHTRRPETGLSSHNHFKILNDQAI